MTQFIETLVGIFQSSGFAKFGEPGGWLYAVMICVGCFLLYLAIVKEFEPLILLPMAFGMILANLPGSGVIHMQYFVGDGLEHPMWVEILNNGGLADMLYMGVKLGIYPPLIFLGIGTMTDFAPLISNPKSLLLGAAAQFGIFGTYMGARLLAATGLVDFTQKQSAAIAIIGSPYTAGASVVKFLSSMDLFIAPIICRIVSHRGVRSRIRETCVTIPHSSWL